MDLAEAEAGALAAGAVVAPFSVEEGKKMNSTKTCKAKQKDRIVVAIGGNALGESDAEQIETVREAAAALVHLMEGEHEIVFVHGNGPQVGIIQKAFVVAHDENPKFPSMTLFDAIAMSQGYLGFYLQRGITNELERQGSSKQIAYVINEVEVDKDDPAFQHPEKPIGLFLDKKQAERQMKAHPDWTYVEDSGRGYRCVVASPCPIKVFQTDVVSSLLDDGFVVFAGGGGGIPVVRRDDGTYEGINVVIDKDLVSALLAQTIQADQLIILTAVEYVAINFGKPNQESLRDLSVEEAKKYLAQHQFGEGSMKPKVEAAISFVESHPGRTAIIGSLMKAEEVVSGTSGTCIHE